MKKLTDKQKKEYIGLTVSQAEKKWGECFHVAEEDGICFAKTMVLKSNRLNVRVEKGHVVEVIGLG